MYQGPIQVCEWPYVLFFVFRTNRQPSFRIAKTLSIGDPRILALEF